VPRSLGVVPSVPRSLQPPFTSAGSSRPALEEADQSRHRLIGVHAMDEVCADQINPSSHSSSTLPGDRRRDVPPSQGPTAQRTEPEPSWKGPEPKRRPHRSVGCNRRGRCGAHYDCCDGGCAVCGGPEAFTSWIPSPCAAVTVTGSGPAYTRPGVRRPELCRLHHSSNGSRCPTTWQRLCVKRTSNATSCGSHGVQEKLRQFVTMVRTGRGRTRPVRPRRVGK